MSWFVATVPRWEVAGGQLWRMGIAMLLGLALSVLPCAVVRPRQGGHLGRVSRTGRTQRPIRFPDFCHAMAMMAVAFTFVHGGTSSAAVGGVTIKRIKRIKKIKLRTY
ncbi:hypothetical protein HYFRA_00009478 [Hymenoscyphus fraxineus]|uniref:Uncharacterized protein n=1 Tax=Hymenoscyphus fraxineus TaxID=746836 RepID=A0A9N9KWA2_9HELO|nr:hypothetical protein HYFRA_00009478 [Hymenoscyphus fraxineus]